MEYRKAFGDPWFRDLHIPYPVFWGRPYFVPSGSPFLVAYASAALHAMSYGLTHDRLLISALVYASFAILRRLRYSWRYGFADELLRMRRLIVVCQGRNEMPQEGVRTKSWTKKEDVRVLS